MEREGQAGELSIGKANVSCPLRPQARAQHSGTTGVGDISQWRGKREEMVDGYKYLWKEEREGERKWVMGERADPIQVSGGTASQAEEGDQG